MAKEKPDTKSKKKATNSAFQKFERLARRIVNAPKDRKTETPSS